MAEEPAMNVLAGRRILVVEDEYMIAHEIAWEIEACGGEVAGPVPTVERACALIESEGDRLDAAILDVNLNGEMTFPVADALMARGIPFVFATGYDKAAGPAAYAGVPRYGKPVDIGVVARRLAHSLAG